MSNTWFDIQLNDINNGNSESVTESQVSINNNNNNQLKSDPHNGFDNYVSFNNNSNETNGLESPFLFKESGSSSCSLSPNYSVNENQFDFDVGINVPTRGRISAMVDELLNDIYCNLRSYRNRGYSVSSDTSNYSTPEFQFQKKSFLRDVFLKAKGKYNY